ncbi:MAG: DUF420 domain-containing protein [Halobacteria archaeon]|nr:DUF420 domain-containing protein [Halobacteria archaeon]
MSHSRVERRAWVISLILSVISVSLIGLSSRQLLPSAFVIDVPRGFLEVIPHINAVLVLAGLVTVSLGYRAVRRGNVRRHARLMTTTTILFFTFLALYLLRLSNLGVTEFPGSETVYTFVYLPFLAVHMLLAIICIPLVLYSAIVAAVLDISEIPKTRHPRIGRIAVPLWGVSFAFGFVVYLMLHHLF